MYTQIVMNYSGHCRRETLNGKAYVVASLSMIVPGVLDGSKGPLFYPRSEIARNFDAWNGIPIVVNHPKGSARDPHVLDRQGIGFVFRAEVRDGKLIGEGWFDVEKTQRVEPRILNALSSNQPMELSTGLFINAVPSKGNYMGKNYTHIASNYRPDHLAVLPDTKGACSINDGCGVLMNQMNRLTKRKSAPLVIPRMKFGDDEPVANVRGPLVIPVMNFSSAKPEARAKPSSCGCRPTTATGPLIVPTMTF